MTPCLHTRSFKSYYHMVEHKLAKKVAISVTIDGDLLRGLDNRLREIQSRELAGGRLRSNRSTLFEEILRDWADKED